jgi:hypothetical protein
VSRRDLAEKRGPGRIRTTTLVVLGALFVLLVCLTAAPGIAASADSGPAGTNDGQRAPEARPGGRMFGVAPAALDAASRPHRPTWNEFAGTKFATGSNLSYHGGPVMTTNKTYLIYWAPSDHPISATYESLIDGFFQNVAADSSKTTNVYASDTQYSNIAYSSTAGGPSWVDTTAIPDHCSGQYKAPYHVSGCVLDTDIQAAVSRAILANPGWTAPGANVMYFVFTPQNVGSCFDSSSGTCAYNYYCAYHSNFAGASNTDVIYANQPYTDTSGVGAPGACDAGQHPNGDVADATINVASHEHNEAITDPHGNAWYDSSGNENGDKCAWNFGAALGNTGSGLYNQAIGTGKYYLQQEWSNASSSCVLTYTTPAPASFSLTASPSSSTVTRGGTTSFAVTVKGTGTVSLAVSGLPGRTTGSFSPNPVTATATGQQSTLTVRTSTRTTRGQYNLTITGSSGTVKSTAQVTLVVN